MTTRIPHLLNRNGRYSARVVIPKPLRSFFDGRWEMSAPLGPDRREAIRRLPGAVAEIQSQIDAAPLQLRASYKPKNQPRSGKPLTERQMAAMHYAGRLAADDQERATYATDHPPIDMSWTKPAYEALLRQVVSGRASNEEIAAAVGWVIDSMRDAGHTDVVDNSQEWRALARTMAGVQLEVHQRQTERDQGTYDDTPKHAALAPVTPPPADPLTARIMDADSTKTLSEIFPRYTIERNATPATNKECEVTIRMFEEYLEQPKPLYRITRQDILGFKRALTETPTSYTKRFPGMTMPQAIVANKKRKEPYPPLVAKTINDKYLSRLHSILAWCAKGDIIPDNPAAGVRVDVVKSNKPSRLHFNDDDLARIFPGEMFEKPLGEFEWAMLISLYAGMRASELAQMKIASIRKERGILVFAIEEETKNAGSQRIVPVHSSLARYGLEDRIETLRKSGETHLFPAWYRNGMTAKANATSASMNHFFPRYIPRYFKRTYLPKVGIVDPLKVWHSFRHTFKTGLARGGVDKATRDYLAGHVDGSAGAAYVHDISVTAMDNAIETLAFGFGPEAD